MKNIIKKHFIEIQKIANQSIIVNSNKTASIQETHKIIFHSICETFENI